MKFSYEYKTSDNEKHDGVIAASSKDEVYRQLKAKGIHPFNVVLAPGLFNRVQSLGKRGLAIVVLCALCLVLCAVLIRTAHQAQSTMHEAQTADRHQIYGDPAIMEEMLSTGFADVFSHPGERYLAYFAQPGREVSVPPDLTRLIAQSTKHQAPGTKHQAPGTRHKAQGTILSSCLTNVITFAEADPREVLELKRIVNGMKGEMRDYLEEGSAADYVRELWDRQREEQMIYRRVLNELEGSGDPNLLAERNKTLRELGLPAIPRSKKP